MKRIGFRGRLFLILLVFAALPSIVLTLAWGGTSWFLLPFVGSTAAWDSTASTGARALSVARERRNLTRADSQALARHEQTLRTNQLRSTQARYVVERGPPAAAHVAFVAFGVLLVVASRVAGHLSRGMSRPLQELVGWTELIAQERSVPDTGEARGAPEFGVLRARMRQMSLDLARGR